MFIVGVRGVPTCAPVDISDRSIYSYFGPIDLVSAHSPEGAAVDVFETEPLPPDHPLRTLPNVLATPHIGYVAENLYRTFYGDAAAAIADWLDTVREAS